MALDKIVCVTGISRGTGFEVKAEEVGLVEEAVAADEGWLGETSEPGGREPTGVTGMEFPSVLETLMAGVPFSEL